MKFRNISRKYFDEAGGDGAAGGGAGEASNWRDGLPDEIKASPALANFEDISQVAKAFVDMKSYQGNSISIPGEDAGDEQRQQFVEKLIEKAPNVMLRPDLDNPEQSRDFYRTMGMPDKSDGYGVPEIKDLPEGVNQDSERLDFFREIAHKAGLTKGQFDKIMSEVITQDISTATSTLESQKAEMESLKQEWGAATDDRLGQALGLMEKTKAPDHLIEAMKNNQLPADIIKWAHSLAVSIGQEGTNLGNSDLSNNGAALTPQEAQDKIDEIYANKDHPFHKGDPAAMKRMVDLVAAKNPGSSKDVNDLRKGMSFTQ